MVLLLERLFAAYFCKKSQLRLIRKSGMRLGCGNIRGAESAPNTVEAARILSAQPTAGLDMFDAAEGLPVLEMNWEELPKRN